MVIIIDYAILKGVNDMEENKERPSIVEKETIEEVDDWYTKEIKKTVFTSLFSLLVSIVVLILTLYSN